MKRSAIIAISIIIAGETGGDFARARF